jgi:transcription antitermination factor NusG
MSTLQTNANEPLLTKTGLTPDQKSWFAVQTRPRFEKKVDVELKEKGVKTFLPLSTVTHQWSDRRKQVQLPIFPGYVFVRIAPSLNVRVSVLQTNGVRCFVGLHNMGIPIPDCEIEAIQSVIEGGATVEPYPHLNIGQRVRIRGGCFDGVSGVLLTVNGDRSLIVSVNLIQRSVAMRIEGYEVEAA